VLGESAFNGSSEMVGQLAAAVTTFLFNAAMMRLLGEDGVAAITIMIYSQFMLSTFFIGFSMGVAPVISYNYGRGDQRNLKRVTTICLCVTGAVSVATTILTLALGGMLVGVYAPQGSVVYTIARAGFWIFPFAFLFIGFNIFVSAMFTALSNGKLSAVLSFSRSLLIAFGIIVLPGVLGVDGVWQAVPLAELLSLGLALGLLLRNRRRYRYV
jgi:Na+-driven multidrug efflux pump